MQAISTEAYADSDYAEPGYFDEAIEIRLSQDEAHALGGTSFEAIVLAYRIYDYWHTRLGE